MKIARVIVDNSTAFLGLLTALIGLLTVFGMDLTRDQIAAIMTFAGALITVLAAVATVTKRRVVTVVDNAGVIRNGQAAVAPTGVPAEVTQDPQTGLITPQAAVKPGLLAT